MFDEHRTNKAERDRIKKIPPAHDKGRFNVGNTKIDRIRTGLFVGIPVAIAASIFGFVVLRNSNPDNEGCQYPDMVTDEDQTKVLQDFLHDNGLYIGPIDGNYGQLTVQAVKNFQQNAHVKGTYNSSIDGIAGELTCQAMGEPYYIINE